MCDPCCGICDFPAMAFRHDRNDEEYPPNASNYYGFDTNSNLKLAELNLVLNGDGGAVLKNLNSISQKLLQNGDILKVGEFVDKNYNIKDWSNKDDSEKDLKKFKIIATNPPFGKGRDLKTVKMVNGKKQKKQLIFMKHIKLNQPNNQGKITLHIKIN